MQQRELFYYSYPKELIAQQPLPERDQSRMMVLDRTQKKWEHTLVKKFPSFLRKGDLLVFNDTKVFPARLLGWDEQKRPIEILLLEKNGNGSWCCLAKPLKKIKEGSKIYFAEDLSGIITKKEEAHVEIVLDDENRIEKVGLPPLPPYIQRKTKEDYSQLDKERYQSIFAERTGSAAAPTASLHFSQTLFNEIKFKNIETATITLHVSTDTFLPIREEDITKHKMHGERLEVPQETREKIKKAKAEKKRVLAIGTTVVRALESDWSKPTTNLFIYPGFEFKVVDGLLTNFHQPDSTLIALVASFAGREFLLEAYQEAITKQYRLFSYGDCMLLF